MIVHDAAAADEPAVRDLVKASIVYAGDGLAAQEELPQAEWPLADGARVAADDMGLVGMYGLLVRRGTGGIEAELTVMLVACRARHRAVDRLLLLDARQHAALRGARELTILARPPMDVFFRDLGACPTGIAVPFGGITWPRLRLELPV